MSSLQSWISEHKVATVGTLWASTVAASLAYTRNKYPLRGGVRLIHSRLHAQALTLAVLSGLAAKHYYFDSKNGNDDRSACSPDWSEINLAEGSDDDRSACSPDWSEINLAEGSDERWSCV